MPKPGLELELFGAEERESVVIARDPAALEPVRSMESRVAEPRVAEPRIMPTAPPGAAPDTAIPVALLTQTAKEVVEGAFVPVWIRGEVSDFKAHRNGHWYFCLRDAESQIRCVVWRGDQRAIPAPPDDGMEVVALGQLGVYAARGEMQFTVKRMMAEGDGLWRKALEEATRRLAKEGLLDPSRKRPLPRFPRRVAVITSASGAALRDVIAVARRRDPRVEIVLIPAQVQGENAPESLRDALATLGRWAEAGEVDACIVGRGGGSREDLWAFNDERVARAVAASPVPIVSAVGHEVDVSLCDLVADFRAATPSQAAEALVPVAEELRHAVHGLAGALRDVMARRIEAERSRLAGQARELAFLAGRQTERRRARVREVAGRLHALSPLATLARGYAVARDTTGRTIGSVAALPPGTAFTLQLRDGTIAARAESSEGQGTP